MPVDVASENPQDARDTFRRKSGPWDLLIHCAAVVNGRQTIEHRPMDQAVDFELDAAMFRWALENEVGQVVYFSSSAAYPIHLQTGVPYQLTEDDINLATPSLPDALYGWTKLTGEHLATHARKAGLNVLVVRPFSGYGEDQDLCYPFPAIIRRAVMQEDPFTVWGSGKQVRDFVHVDDIVNAVLTFTDKSMSGPINIGTGRATSMTDLAIMAADACDFVANVSTKSEEPEGVLYRVASTTQMEQFYTPQVSLEEGIDRAVHYVRRHR